MSENAIAVLAGVAVVGLFSMLFAMIGMVLVYGLGCSASNVWLLAVCATGIVACKVWRLVEQDWQR